MKNVKEILLNFNEKDFLTNVNLHIHTSHSDGKELAQDIINQAKELEYKKISITDHNTLNAYLKEDILSEDFLITGIEFDCWYYGCLIHILGYGIDVNSSEIQKLCAKNKAETESDITRLLNKRHPKEVISAIHSAGGVAILAHPACCWVLCLDDFVKRLVDLGLDGLEVFYPYRRHRGILKFHSVNKVKKIAQKYNLIMTGGTDEHSSLVS